MREKIIELLGEDVCIHDCCGDCECQGNEDMCIALLKEYMADHLIANDVVPVVRCKDCKHWNHMGDGVGDCTNGRFHLDGCQDPTMVAEEFCCLGERKDNGKTSL